MVAGPGRRPPRPPHELLADYARDVAWLDGASLDVIRHRRQRFHRERERRPTQATTPPEAGSLSSWRRAYARGTSTTAELAKALDDLPPVDAASKAILDRLVEGHPAWLALRADPTIAHPFKGLVGRSLEGATDDAPRTLTRVERRGGLRARRRHPELVPLVPGLFRRVLEPAQQLHGVVPRSEDTVQRKRRSPGKRRAREGEPVPTALIYVLLFVALALVRQCKRDESNVAPPEAPRLVTPRSESYGQEYESLRTGGEPRATTPRPGGAYGKTDDAGEGR